MKRQIRNSVFETNSSSTHSICISKKPAAIRDFIHFRIGEFGWENDCVDTTDYLYTAILEQYDADELLERLKEILDNHSIEYEFEEPHYDISSDGQYKWLNDGYIDHSDEARDFVLAVLNDEDLLMRCLFSADSCVYTGNDNQDCHPSGCNIADETMWMYERGKYVEKPNPNHDSENYDYFYKGN